MDGDIERSKGSCWVGGQPFVALLGKLNNISALFWTGTFLNFPRCSSDNAKLLVTGVFCVTESSLFLCARLPISSLPLLPALQQNVRNLSVLTLFNLCRADTRHSDTSWENQRNETWTESVFYVYEKKRPFRSRITCSCIRLIVCYRTALSQDLRMRGSIFWLWSHSISSSTEVANIGTSLSAKSDVQCIGRLGSFQIWCPHRRGEGDSWKNRCSKWGCMNFIR